MYSYGMLKIEMYDIYIKCLRIGKRSKEMYMELLSSI